MVLIVLPLPVPIQANQREKLQREEDTGGSQKLASNENYRAEP
jgi:hypothetical protein